MTSIHASSSFPRLSPDADAVFCAPFALAWQRLKERIGPIEMEPQPALADALNAMKLGASVVDPAWSVVGAGLGSEGIVETLRRELAEKFPGFDPEYLPSSIPPDTLLAYGYLSKSLTFRTPFAVQEGTFLDSIVRTFGLQGSPFGADPARRTQVLVHDWLTPSDFVIELIADDPDSYLLIAQVPPEETLAATTAKAMSRLGTSLGDARHLANDELLSIPRLDLDIEQLFGELLGRPLLAEQVRGKRFEEAKQRVQFHLNEGGAGIKSEAALGGYGVPAPRSFQVTQPFLVLMTRRGASSPYLAAWVATTAWMNVLGKAAKPAAAGFYDPSGFGPPPGFGPPRQP